MTIHRFVAYLAAAAAVLLVDSARAELQLHGLFTDHAVFQREIGVPVWGTTDAGDDVVVQFAGQTKTAKPVDGAWRIDFAPLKAGGPHVLSVKQGDTAIERKDLLVGEVWLCSGQSNMAWRVDKSLNAKEEITAADLPKIRMFTVPRKPADKPQTNVGGNWAVASPNTVGGFSATAFFFGRELHKELDVPIGLINSSVGGTPIEAWTNREIYKKNRDLAPVLAAKADGPGKGIGVLYNGMIAPLQPYAVRGAIWYQGERNSKIGRSTLYQYQMPAMIDNWRSDWDRSAREFPFIHVQLPDFQAAQTKPSETSGWVQVREGMFKTLSTTPNTGMAVTLGLGDARDIHPKNKQGVGKRLSLWALANTYGQDVAFSGPLFDAFEVGDDVIVLHFDHAEGLKAAGDGPLEGFAIAGDDQKFVWAKARIDGKRIIVSSPNVAEPAAVRYAWAANPKGNLTNASGLPASPFRTDDWEE